MLVSRNADISTFKYYRYNPSLAAAIVFAIAFVLLTSFHLFQMTRTRTWFFTSFCIGGIFESIGYIGRAASASQSPNWTLGPYLIQSLFLLIAPALFAASIYMELGRIVQMTEGDKYILVRRTWMTKIFVCGDILSFLMQSTGGGLLGTGNQANFKMGQNIIVGGLFVQLIFFGAFLIFSILFHIRMKQSPTQRANDTPWQRHVVALWAGSLLVLVRSVFRIIEYLQGWEGYILSHEVYLYVFDACLMLLVMIIFNWAHPSQVSSSIRGGRYMKGIKTFEMSELAHGSFNRV